MVKKKNLWITLFVMPCMVLFCIVYAVPIVTVLFTSFCDYTITTKPAFSGLKNFQLIFGDKDFLISIKNTLVWVALQSTFHVMLGLLMALVLRRKPKGWNPQYYSDSSDRRYVHTSVKPQLWYPQIYVRRVRP